MAVIAWLIVLFLGIRCSVGEMGCKEWELKGNDVCCNSCHPGNKEKKDPEFHKSLQIDSTFICFCSDVQLFCLFVFNGALLN